MKTDHEVCPCHAPQLGKLCYVIIVTYYDVIFSDENSTQVPNGIMLPKDLSTRRTAKAISTATIVGKKTESYFMTHKYQKFSALVCIGILVVVIMGLVTALFKYRRSSSDS